MNDSHSQFDYPILLADIGGTNARFRWLKSADANSEELGILKTADFPTVDAALLVALEGRTVTTAIIAAAGPITDAGLDLTNCHWVIDPPSLIKATGMNQLVLVNDFTAQALALPDLDKTGLTPIGDGKPGEKTRVVVGPGTGLGVAVLAFVNGKWIPVSGEGGHVDLGPRTVRETAIWSHLDTVEGRVSAEQVLSGRGIANLYRAVCAVRNVPARLADQVEISTAALNGEDGAATETLDLFCIFLGRLAGDLALTFMATGGVFIAGGIATKILPLLQQSSFRAAFEDKAPHKAILRSISTYVVTHDQPALEGLEAFARTPDRYLMELDGNIWSKSN